jgi:hypothetical protein
MHISDLQFACCHCTRFVVWLINTTLVLYFSQKFVMGSLDTYDGIQEREFGIWDGRGGLPISIGSNSVPRGM